MKSIKLLSLILALGVSAVAITACDDNKKQEVTPVETQQEIAPVEEVEANPVEENEIIEGMGNPIVDYASVEDAVITVGHLSPLPSIYERYTKKASVISGTLIQIDYLDDNGLVLTLREERRPSGDISGVYNEYAYNSTFQSMGIEVTVRGSAENSINLVTWNDGAFSHSINYVDGHTLEEITDVVNEINA